MGEDNDMENDKVKSNYDEVTGENEDIKDMPSSSITLIENFVKTTYENVTNNMFSLGSTNRSLLSWSMRKRALDGNDEEDFTSVSNDQDKSESSCIPQEIPCDVCSYQNHDHDHDIDNAVTVTDDDHVNNAVDHSRNNTR